MSGKKKRSGHHWVWFWLAILPTIVLAMGVVNLRVSAETRVLAGPENPVRLDLEAFEARFAQNNNLLFVVDPGSTGVFTAEALAAIDDITDRAWRLPHVSRVDSLTNFPLIISTNDEFGVVPLAVDGLPQTARALAHAQEQILAEPWLSGLLVDQEGRYTGINALFIIPPEATAEIAEIMAGVDDLLLNIEAEHPGVSIYVTGNIALMNAFAESAHRDISGLIPLAFLFVALIALIFLRDLKLFGILTVYLALCCVGAMGAAGWVGHILNPATVAAPIIIMTLGLASIIHLMSGVQMARARTDTTSEAVDIALDETRNAIIITILTTMLGFLCMNFAASPPLRFLGNTVAVGLAIALVLALYAIPPVLRRLNIKPRTIPAALLTRVFEIIDRRRALVLLFTIGLATFAVTGAFNIRADDDFIRYFDKGFEYRQASDFAEDNLTGLNLLEFAFESGESNGINDPAYFARLDNFTNWLREQPGVEHVTSMSDKMMQLNVALTPGASPGSLPQSRDTIAQYLLLYELSLPAGNDIADRLDADRQATRVTVSLRHVTSADIREFNYRARVWLAANNPVSTQQAGHSINYFFARLSLANIQSMIGGTALALILISIIVLTTLRDTRLGVVSLIANMLPPLAGFGIWGYTVGEVGLASSVVAAMTFGIVVDDTIHFLLRFKKEVERGVAEREAVRIAYVSVGRAMIITSLALTAGFLLLMASGFEINSSLGLFTSIIVMSALVLDLTLVPAMLLALRRN